MARTRNRRLHQHRRSKRSSHNMALNAYKRCPWCQPSWTYRPLNLRYITYYITDSYYSHQPKLFQHYTLASASLLTSTEWLTKPTFCTDHIPIIIPMQRVAVKRNADRSKFVYFEMANWVGSLQQTREEKLHESLPLQCARRWKHAIDHI